jgi:hypothetical protein
MWRKSLSQKWETGSRRAIIRVKKTQEMLILPLMKSLSPVQKDGIDVAICAGLE